MAALSACVAVGVWGTGTASADEETSFLFDLQANGFTNSKGGAAAFVRQGRGICERLGGGEGVDSVAHDIINQTGTDVTSAYLFVSLTTRNLCPALSAVGEASPPAAGLPE